MNYEKMMKDWDDSIPEGVKRMSKTNREQELKIRTLEAEIERLKTVLTEIRDLALTGLAPDSLNLDTEKKWLRYKVNKIAAMASMELDKGRE